MARKSNFDPDLQRDLYEFDPVETEFSQLIVIIQQYNEKIPEVYTRRQNNYGSKIKRRLGRFKFEELPLLIPVYIEAYKWIVQWCKENHREITEETKK